LNANEYTTEIDKGGEIVKGGVQGVEKHIDISQDEGDVGRVEASIEIEFDKPENGIGKENDEGGVDVVMGPEFNHTETEVEEGGVKEQGGVAERIKSKLNKLNKVIIEDDEGGVDVFMGPEFNHIETAEGEGGVKEKGSVFEKTKFNSNDDEGGVDMWMDLEFDQVKQKLEQGGVVERDLDIMKKDDDEGGVDVVMGPEFDQIDIAIEEGGVMGENDKKGGVYELKLNMFANETGIEEGGVMVEGDEKGG
ncbi:hypothetical protein ROZALSC1DRAFT_25974, partial [Rozella allomycis CSF55]